MGLCMGEMTACHAQVVEACMLLVEDNNAVGRILMVHVNGKFYDWKAPKGNLQQIRQSSSSGMHKASATRAYVHSLGKCQGTANLFLLCICPGM